MAAPILPTADEIVSAAIDAIVALRPEALAHFNDGGRWMDLPAMWRAQALLPLRRLSDEVKSRRLRTATGAALRALCASEFNTTLSPAPQPAFAKVLLSRPAPLVGTAPSGIVRAGGATRFTKLGNPDGIPLPAANAYPLPYASATYNVIAPAYVPPGVLSLSVTCVAVTPGIEGNVPVFSNYAPPTLLQPAKALFDPTFVVTSCSAGGGSSGAPDPVLVEAAKAFAIGQFGPTDGALLAGVLREQSVRHYAAFQANNALGYAQVYVADESWASSDPWVQQVAQHFASSWQGFGCRVRFGGVTNLQITIAPTIVLASSDDLNYTDVIDQKVRAAAAAYFNTRPDWYSWRAGGLRAALTKADPRILACTSVTVFDGATHAVLAEPVNALATSNVYQTTWSPTVTHYYLTDQGVTSTYQPPT